VHVLEQYLTPRQAGELQSAQAEAVLRTLISIAPACLREPVDLDARAELMWCATQALNGLIACGLPQDWATHMIGHELTALHGWDHARTLSLVLPARLRYDLAAKAAILARYGRRVWDLQGDDSQVAAAAIGATVDLFRSLDMPVCLGDLESAPDACAAAVAALRARDARLGEDARLDADAVAAILAAAA